MNKRLRQLNHFVRALITIAEINREGGGGAWEPLPDKTNPFLSEVTLCKLSSLAGCERCAFVCALSQGSERGTSPKQAAAGWVGLSLTSGIVLSRRVCAFPLAQGGDEHDPRQQAMPGQAGLFHLGRKLKI